MILMELLIQTIFVFVGGLLYIKYKPDPLLTMEEADKEHSLEGDFKHSLFGCCQVPGITLFTCCCEGIRWADSMRMINMLPFSSAVMTWLMVNCVCFLLAVGGAGGPILSTVVVAGLLTYYRQGLRDAFR